MIDTSQFEFFVSVSEISNDGNIQKINFVNRDGNVVKSYKYRTRKVKQTEEVTSNE